MTRALRRSRTTPLTVGLVAIALLLIGIGVALLIGSRNTRHPATGPVAPAAESPTPTITTQREIPSHGPDQAGSQPLSPPTPEPASVPRQAGAGVFLRDPELAADEQPDADGYLVDPQVHQAADPESDPVPAEPAGVDDPAAAATAMAVMAAFARPTPGAEAGWWDRVRAFLSPQARLDYAGTDPSQVPYTSVTGPPTPLPADHHDSHLDLQVAVPTDIGRYIVHLQPDHTRAGGYAVTGLTPPSGVGP